MPVDNDVENYIKSVNEEIGYNVLCIYKDRVTLNCTILRKLFEKYSFNFIKDEFHDNLFLQLSLTKFLQDGLKQSEPLFTDYFNANGLNRSAFRERIVLTNLKKRSMRLDLSELVLEFIRPQLQAIISPIQSNIINFLEQGRVLIMKLFVPDNGSKGFLQTLTQFTNTIVLQLADSVSSIEDSINTAINNVIYNNGTTTPSATTIKVS